MAEPPEDEPEEPHALSPIAAAQTDKITAKVFLVITTFFIEDIGGIGVVMVGHVNNINKIGIRSFRGANKRHPLRGGASGP